MEIVDKSCVGFIADINALEKSLRETARSPSQRKINESFVSRAHQRLRWSKRLGDALLWLSPVMAILERLGDFESLELMGGLGGLVTWALGVTFKSYLVGREECVLGCNFPRVGLVIR